jgi:hypothetical protein
VANSTAGVLLFVIALSCAALPARGDLIRMKPSRWFPDIAGDIVGSQTYTYDPVTQTGTFAVFNAPHLISLGPSVKDLVPLRPDRDGTLTQSLLMKLDRRGKLIESSTNKFEIRGTVVIGDQTYQGLLLEGKPTAFGAVAQEASASKNTDVFDLNMKITGGELAATFGPEAYLRIVPQAGSTFNGEFTSDFSGEKPLTNLRAISRTLPASVPEPTALTMLLVCGSVILACRMRRQLARKARRRRGAQAEGETSEWVASTLRPNAAR